MVKGMQIACKHFVRSVTQLQWNPICDLPRDFERQQGTFFMMMPMVPPALFCQKFTPPARIIESALGVFVAPSSRAAAFQRVHGDGAPLPCHHFALF